MEKSHKKNIFIKGSKHPTPNLDHINLKGEEFLIIDLDYFQYSNLAFFVELAPFESASFCLGKTGDSLFLYDKAYKKVKSNFDGLSFSGLIKTKNPHNYDFESLTAFPLPKTIGTRKIVFLDRDGVLNINTGYPHVPSELIVNQSILPSLKNAKLNGYEFIVITNQSGIARGIFSQNDYHKCVIHLTKYFEDQGIHILDWFHCPYHLLGKVDQFSKESIDRKPLPGMILKACDKYDIDLKSSIMVGDNISDNILLPYLDFQLIDSNNLGFFV